MHIAPKEGFIRSASNAHLDPHDLVDSDVEPDAVHGGSPAARRRVRRAGSRRRVAGDASVSESVRGPAAGGDGGVPVEDEDEEDLTTMTEVSKVRAASFHHGSSKRTRPSKDEYFCRQLHSYAERAISVVQLDDAGAIYAVVGDMHMCKWESARAPSFLMYKFRRESTHATAIRQYTTTLAHESLVLVLEQGGHMGYSFDLDTKKEKTFRFPLPSKAQPLFFDGQLVTWMDELGDGTKDVVITDVLTRRGVGHLHFPRKGRAYWGFQVSGRFIAYVSNHRVLKVHVLPPEEDEDAQAEEEDEFDLELSRGPRLGRCMRRFASHKGDILCFLLVAYGRELIALGADRKLKIWDVYEGRTIASYYNLRGKFDMNMPYFMQLHGRYLFYTADDGLYALELRRE